MLKFDLLTTQGHARRGRLTLTHGVIETPVFMPVRTYGTVKVVMPQSLQGMGAQIILGGTFHRTRTLVDDNCLALQAMAA